jgi:hypothetical protein
MSLSIMIMKIIIIIIIINIIMPVKWNSFTNPKWYSLSPKWYLLAAAFWAQLASVADGQIYTSLGGPTGTN